MLSKKGFFEFFALNIIVSVFLGIFYNIFFFNFSENLELSALGLLDYFETAVGTILLYKFERPAFNDLVAELEKRRAEEAENESEQAVVVVAKGKKGPGGSNGPTGK